MRGWAKACKLLAGTATLPVAIDTLQALRWKRRAIDLGLPSPDVERFWQRVKRIARQRRDSHILVTIMERLCNSCVVQQDSCNDAAQ